MRSFIYACANVAADRESGKARPRQLSAKALADLHAQRAERDARNEQRG